jgi:hypothetical protein
MSALLVAPNGVIDRPRTEGTALVFFAEACFEEFRNPRLLISRESKPTRRKFFS